MENVTLPTSWGITTDQEARLEGIGGRISIYIVSLSISIPSRIRIKIQKERKECADEYCSSYISIYFKRALPGTTESTQKLW